MSAQDSKGTIAEQKKLAEGREVVRQGEYVILPRWTYAGSRPDRYTLATALALAGLEDKGYVRLYAWQQREAYGNATRIGKKKIFIFSNGAFYTSFKVAFGLDYEQQDL